MPQAKAASTRRSSKSSTSSGSSTQRAAPKPSSSSSAPAPGPEDAPDAASPWAPVSHRERQREAKRNAVLQAAAQLFNERGFHATSLDDIAARLNVTKPTLYYYVKNKDEILLQCVGKGLAMMLEGIDASRAAGGKAIDQLMTCMQVYARIVTMDFGMCLIRVGDEQVPPESRKELRRLKSAIDQEFRRLVAEGVAEGSIQPCDPKITAFVIAGALSWIGRWYQPGGEYTAEQVAQQCIATLCDGVLRRPADSTALNTAAVPAPKRRAASSKANTAVRPSGG
ncbi:MULTISPECIES: TetR/AcrR family transcriptional regulator [unclassified Acidovorax]|jgi:AcrR family transcriptional regulator|uniref:TetR/AcrR family transcriptional regulator n=1 Tax=unclassified Acidovorax TaxID=2684926 RepID=UPI001C46DE4F|nr:MULTISPECIES: TetR/AcrR family transcriptional regulator [unclassified Acidovorax]MBV7461622.1 TetR/AcrR family transcriptional regulator [Acidovorax sp. sif0632]MBV7466274.1 TetR/AcrR family transcriptional regulator [Acidovorax sp. sif0613]